jgi:hypothetical protein
MPDRECRIIRSLRLSHLFICGQTKKNQIAKPRSSFFWRWARHIHGSQPFADKQNAWHPELIHFRSDFPASSATQPDLAAPP